MAQESLERQAASLWPMTAVPRFYVVILLLCGAVFISYIDRTNISVAAIAMRLQFGWSETQKGLVLSAFYAGYITLMLGNGVLANRFGGQRVLAAAILWWSVLTILTPIAAAASLPALIAARIALGLGESAVFPASMNLIARYVPPLHRSRAVAMLVSSLHCGTLFALPVTGWLVERRGWPVPFYAFSLAGLVWAVVLLVGLRRSAPVAVAEAGRRAPIPWRGLLRQPAVWAIVVAHFSANWPLYLASAWLPSYFVRTYGVSTVNAGLFAAAPSLAGVLAANAGGYLADRMLAAGMRTGSVRKLIQGVALLGGAAAFLLLTRATTPIESLVLLCCAAGIYSLSPAGFGANAFDVAPRHADIVWGLSNTIATLPGVIGVAVTGWLVDRTGSFAAPFVVTAGVSVVGALVYVTFASGEKLVD